MPGYVRRRGAVETKQATNSMSDARSNGGRISAGSRCVGPTHLDPAEIRPPFDLASDMLFVACFVSTAPLRRTYPGIPFLSLLGRTPLVLWFSRVSEGCYRDQASAVHCLGGPQETLYNEVTILAVLRKRALFCPLIYASNDLSIPIARLYAMPKQAQPMD